ncbi:MAG: HEAT repeat domain-containing protein [Candidatus Polarisedimenticolia bacterium]
MLKGSRPESAMAAALVLSELAPKDAGVVKAIAAALQGAPRPLKLALMETLGRIASPASVPELLSALDGADEEVRDRAIQALVKVGPAAIKPIARQTLDAPPAARRALLAVLARVKTAESVAALTSLVPSGHPEAAREAGQSLVTLSHAMGRSEQARLRSMVEKLLKTAPDKAPSGSLSAALLVMAAIGAPGAAQGMLKLTGPKYPEVVRRDALLAIAAVLKGGTMPAGVLAGILPILQDGPSPALRSAALEALSTVRLPAAAMEPMLKMLDHADPAARRFAARKLAEPGMGGAKVSRRLISLLLDSDPSLRDAAAESLGRLPEAAAPLVDELMECEEIHRAWAIAHILKHHVARLRRPVVRQVFDRAVEALVTDNRIWEPLLNVVRRHDPKIVYEWLMEESARFKKARKYAEAEACLIPLSRGDHFDSEARYALALAGIQAARSRGSRAASSGAHGLDLFRQLVRDPAFPLVDRLKKERGHLENDDLYQIGFALAEGTPEEKEAGAELLRIVVARSGASKLGRSAKNKLRVEGLGL